MIGVVTQPLVIPATVFHCIPLPPLSSPMPITAPTIAWELDTGTSGMVGSPDEERVKLLDFGLTKSERPGETVTATGTLSPRVTVTVGSVLSAEEQDQGSGELADLKVGNVDAVARELTVFDWPVPEGRLDVTLTGPGEVAPPDPPAEGPHVRWATRRRCTPPALQCIEPPALPARVRFGARGAARPPQRLSAVRRSRHVVARRKLGASRGGSAAHRGLRQLRPAGPSLTVARAPYTSDLAVGSMPRGTAAGRIADLATHCR